MSGLSPASQQLSDGLLEQFAALVYARSGIRVSPQKKALLSNRLRRRLRATGLADFESYYRRLRQLPEADAEWGHFLEEVSTHETYLFRDESHWRWLQDDYLPEAADAARRGKRPRRLRIWSAACSTGDEAYSIAACVAAGLPDLRQWRIEILGADLGVDAIRQAQRGEFGARAMRCVPESLRGRFFDANPREQTWTARPVLRQMIEFRRHNLMTPLRGRTFDLVFLKNVLIYFDAASKQVVLEHVGQTLAPGGYLVTGAAEGVYDLVRGYERLQPWLHRKREDQP